jgi:hypothetical protein
MTPSKSFIDRHVHGVSEYKHFQARERFGKQKLKKSGRQPIVFESTAVCLIVLGGEPKDGS